MESRQCASVDGVNVAVIMAAAVGVEMRSMLTDLGLSAQHRVWTDSNSATRGGEVPRSLKLADPSTRQDVARNWRFGPVSRKKNESDQE